MKFDSIELLCEEDILNIYKETAFSDNDITAGWCSCGQAWGCSFHVHHKYMLCYTASCTNCRADGSWSHQNLSARFGESMAAYGWGSTGAWTPAKQAWYCIYTDAWVTGGFCR